MRCKWIYKQHISLFYTNISSDSLIVVITLSQFFLTNGTATASIVLFIEKNQGIHPMQVLRGHRTIRRKRRRPSMIRLLRIVPQRQLVETTVQFTIGVTMQIRMVSVVIRPNSTFSSSTSILSFLLEPTMECPRCTRIVGAPTVNADSNHNADKNNNDGDEDSTSTYSTTTTTNSIVSSTSYPATGQSAPSALLSYGCRE
jgi:hypothetical protein